MHLKIERIPKPVVDQISPARVESPRFEPPVVNGLRTPTLDFPTIIDVPSYEPPVFFPQPILPAPPPVSPPISETVQDALELSREMNEDTDEKEEETETIILPDPTTGREVVEVPFVGTIPLPTTSEVGLAGTTAVAATAAALIGKSMVEMLVKRLKPAVKKIILKIKEKREKRFTDYELQLYFELEGKVPEQKSAAKVLKKEFADSKMSQLEAHLQRRHQRKLRRKASRDGNKSPAE